MEQKCLKTSVFVNETLFNETLEIAVDSDFTLPDYCPDISKIFKCQAVPRVAAKSINGRTVTVEGCVAITLIYADKEGRLSSFEYQYPFSKSFDTIGECTGANICTKIRTEYINCRAYTGRKVDIHGACSLSVKLFKRKVSDVVSDYDDCNIELKKGFTAATVPMGYEEKYLSIEEEIRIGDTNPIIGSLLRSDANAIVRETKIINDKAVVKGDMSVCLIYCPEGGGTPQSIKTVIPFSQIIEMEGITELCKCDTTCQVAFLDVKPRANAGGENRIFQLNAKILLCCEAYCSNDIAVVFDAFSRKFEADIVRNKMTFQKIIHNISETYHAKQNIELDNSITSVIDIWSNVQSSSAKFEEGNMNIMITLNVGMIVINDKDNAEYLEKSIDLKYKYPIENTLNIPYCEPQIEVSSCNYTIISDTSLEIRADLNITAGVYEKNDVSLISEMTLDEEKPISANRKGAMTIYFLKNDECVWDIARIYNASVEEIMRINELDSEKLAAGSMILVPVM